MKPKERLARPVVVRLPRFLLQLLAWPLLGLIIVTFDDLAPSLLRAVAPLLSGVAPAALPAGRALYPFLQWGLFTPIVVQLAVRFPLFDRIGRNVVLHVVAALGLCLVRIVGEPDRLKVIASVPAPEYLSQSISRDLLIYASVAVAAHLFVLVRQRSVAEREALLAEANAAAAERALREHSLSPELIVRSLDEIARRIRCDPAGVEPLIETFSTFLRSRIAQPVADEAAAGPLRRELGRS